MRKIVQKKVIAKRTIMQKRPNTFQFSIDNMLNEQDEKLLSLTTGMSKDFGSFSNAEIDCIDAKDGKELQLNDTLPTFREKVSSANRVKAGKFNLLNYKQIPTIILVEMHKSEKAPLYRVGDKVCFKSEEMDLSTLKSVVSDYKIGSISAVNEDKVSLIVLASRSEVNGPAMDHGGNIQVLQLSDFAEFHIALESIEESRMHSIKEEIMQFRIAKQSRVDESFLQEHPTARLLTSHPNTIPLSSNGEEPLRANLNPTPNLNRIPTASFEDMADRRIGNRVNILQLLELTPIS